MSRAIPPLPIYGFTFETLHFSFNMLIFSQSVKLQSFEVNTYLTTQQKTTPISITCFNNTAQSVAVSLRYFNTAKMLQYQIF